MQAVAGKPADCDVQVRLADQPLVIDDANEEPLRHQAHCGVGTETKLPRAVGSTPVFHLRNMIVRGRVAQRARDQQLVASALVVEIRTT